MINVYHDKDKKPQKSIVKWTNTKILYLILLVLSIEDCFDIWKLIPATYSNNR